MARSVATERREAESPSFDLPDLEATIAAARRLIETARSQRVVQESLDALSERLQDCVQELEALRAECEALRGRCDRAVAAIDKLEARSRELEQDFVAALEHSRVRAEAELTEKAGELGEQAGTQLEKFAQKLRNALASEGERCKEELASRAVTLEAAARAAQAELERRAFELEAQITRRAQVWLALQVLALLIVAVLTAVVVSRTL